VGWLVPAGDVKRCLIAETELWLCKIAPLRLSFGDHQVGSCLRCCQGAVPPMSASPDF
jgi:hypothetical protein